MAKSDTILHPIRLRSRWAILARRALLLCLGAGLAGCTTQLTPPAQVVPIVNIETTSPESLSPLVVDRPDQPVTFSIDKVTVQGVDPAALRYTWYYDWDFSQESLDLAAVCSGQPTCAIFVCSLRNPAVTEHTILCVVSSAALLPGAVTPIAFPDGAAWDFVQWQVRVEGACP